MAPVKETEFFKLEDYGERLDEYARYFERAGHEHAVGEFTVRYLAMEMVPARIAATIRNAKILVSLRNPIEQVQSWYWHLKKQDQFALRNLNADLSLEDAIEQCPDLLLSHAFYARHLTNWFCHFGRNQFKVIFYEDICDAPLDVLRDLYTFLEVDSGFVPPAAESRDSSVRLGTSPRSPFGELLHRSTYRLLNRAYGPLKRHFGTATAASLKERFRVRQVLDMLFQKPGYSPVSVKTRGRLLQLFSADICELSNLMHRDLGDWLR